MRCALNITEKNIKIKIILNILVLLLILVACVHQEDEKISESKNEPDVMNGWNGNYVHRGYLPNDGYIKMDLLIYMEDERFFGYLNMDGLEKKQRMLTEIIGTQDMIEVHFLEDFSEQDNRKEIFGEFKNGDILFLLKK